VTGKVMALNPLERGIKYARTIRLVQKYNADPDFLTIKFENLIQSPQKVLGNILHFLATRNMRTELSDYYEKIPGSQKHLHQGILAGPAQAKIDEWSRELTHEEIDTIQRVAGPTLERRGYPLIGVVGSRWSLNRYFAKQWCDLLFRHAVIDMTRKTRASTRQRFKKKM
jgi:hypothetical protein